MIGDRAAPGELGPPPVGIKQPPMAADGPFKPALPGLVIGLDEIDPIVLALGAIVFRLGALVIDLGATVSDLGRSVFRVKSRIFAR